MPHLELALQAQQVVQVVAHGQEFKLTVLAVETLQAALVVELAAQAVAAG